MEDDLRGVIPPKKGWEAQTWYLVEVKYNEHNPMHKALFFSGFLNGKNGTPGGYNCLVPVNGTRGMDQDTSIHEVVYLKSLRILYRDKERKSNEVTD